MKHSNLILTAVLLITLTACPGGSNPPPVINSFSATPSSLTLPGTINLQWDVSGATALEIDGGVGAVTPTDKGNKNVSVSSGKTFLLKATNPAGTVSKSLSISVTGPTFTVVETIAGQTGVRGSSDGPGAQATFNYPVGVAATKPAGSTGNEVLVYIAGLTENIRYAQVGYAGNPVGTAIGKGSSGTLDGDANTALVRAPQGIAIGYGDAAYEAYAFWTEDDSCVVRKLTAYPLNGNRKAITVAGKVKECTAADGSAVAARFNRPRGIVHNTRTGETFVADTSNHTIRRIYADSVSTIAGLAGQQGSTDGSGAVVRFSAPTGLVMDRQENLYVAEYATIRKITPAGVVSTIAGKASEAGYKDGPALEARFKGASGIAIDEASNLYVSETVNHTVRKITPEGVVSTIAGVAGVTGAADGNLSVATFNRPSGLAYYNQQLFVADTDNQTIRRIR